MYGEGVLVNHHPLIIYMVMSILFGYHFLVIVRPASGKLSDQGWAVVGPGPDQMDFMRSRARWVPDRVARRAPAAEFS